MQFSLPKSLIIKKNSDFQKIYRQAQSTADRHLVLYYTNKLTLTGQVAFAAGKKLGNAVVRNRCKRLLREAYRHEQHHLNTDYVLLLVARKQAVSSSATDLQKSLVSLAKRIGIYQE